MGDQDYGYYELADGGYLEIVRSCSTERISLRTAYDNLSNPSITAFTINDTATEGVKPIGGFGHWNNLATILNLIPIRICLYE